MRFRYWDWKDAVAASCTSTKRGERFVRLFGHGGELVQRLMIGTDGHGVKWTASRSPLLRSLGIIRPRLQSVKFACRSADPTIHKNVFESPDAYVTGFD